MKKGKGRGRGKAIKPSQKKTVCRSSTTGKTAKGSGKRSQTLETARRSRYGVGKSKVDTEEYGRGKRTKGQSVNYLKLNEGYDDDLDETPSPSPKKAKHLPVRSGPSQHRQSAQKTKTESPKVRTVSTVKTKKDAENKNASVSTVTVEETLIGIPTTTNDGANIPPGSGTELDDSVPQTSSVGVKDAFLGVPDMDNLLLPDLGFSKEFTNADIVNQPLDTTTEPSQDVATTEDELDAADALLSLSNVLNIEPENNLGLEDNSLLVPIGGHAVCEDIAPTESRLGQVEVDQEIARIINSEEQTSLNESQQLPSSSLLGI